MRRRVVVVAVVALLLLAAVWTRRRPRRGRAEPTPYPRRPTAAPLPPLDPADLVIGVITSPETFYRAIAVENTWKPRSRSPVLIFGADVPPLPPAVWNSTSPRFLPANPRQPVAMPVVHRLDVPAGHTHHITKETTSMLQELWTRYPHAKWYMKVDDDNYVLPDNVLWSLQEYDWAEPRLLGHRDDDAIIYGGAGYILSRAAMQILIGALPDCLEAFGAVEHGEDELVSRCLREQGIPAERHPGHYHCNATDAMQYYAGYHFPQGLEPRPLLFHWLTPSQQYKYDYLLRVARIHNLYDTEAPGAAP